MPKKRASQEAKSGYVFGQLRKRSKMLRVGLYARVSTNDQQTLAMQNRAMREYAARRCWTIALQVREVNSCRATGHYVQRARAATPRWRARAPSHAPRARYRGTRSHTGFAPLPRDP